MSTAPQGQDRRSHWDDAYASRGSTGVSWYQPEPRLSLEILDELGVARSTPVVDVGGGESHLVDRLVERGFGDVTVLDVSGLALAHARDRLGPEAPVAWVQADLLEWQPPRRYGLWHDRAVFHFLTEPADREVYRRTMRRALLPGATLIVATFAADGPEYCSGLPVVRYSPEDLAAQLGEDLTVVATRRELHVTPAGVTQPFTWVAARAPWEG